MANTYRVWEGDEEDLVELMSGGTVIAEVHIKGDGPPSAVTLRELTKDLSGEFTGEIKLPLRKGECYENSHFTCLLGYLCHRTNLTRRGLLVLIEDTGFKEHGAWIEEAEKNAERD